MLSSGFIKTTQRTNTLKRMDTSETHICLQEENLLGLGELQEKTEEAERPTKYLAWPLHSSGLSDHQNTSGWS